MGARGSTLAALLPSPLVLLPSAESLPPVGDSPAAFNAMAATRSAMSHTLTTPRPPVNTRRPAFAIVTAHTTSPCGRSAMFFIDLKMGEKFNLKMKLNIIFFNYKICRNIFLIKIYIIENK